MYYDGVAGCLLILKHLQYMPHIESLINATLTELLNKFNWINGIIKYLQGNEVKESNFEL